MLNNRESDYLWFICVMDITQQWKPTVFLRILALWEIFMSSQWVKRYTKLYTHHLLFMAVRTLTGKVPKALAAVKWWIVPSFSFIISIVFQIFYNKYVLFYR